MSWGNYIKTMKIKDFTLKNLQGLFVINSITNASTMQLYEINAFNEGNPETFIRLLKDHNRKFNGPFQDSTYLIRLNHFDRAGRFIFVESINVTQDKFVKDCLEMDLDLSPNRKIISEIKNNIYPEVKTIPSESYIYTKEELIKIIPEIIEWKRNHSKNEKTFNLWKNKFLKLLTKYKLEKYGTRNFQEIEYT